MITLLVITDGRRDCIERTIASATERLHGPVTRRLIYDDSGDAENRAWLRENFESLGFVVTHHAEGRQGFSGAIRFMWDHLATWDANPFVFHLEDDFTFGRDVDLASMATVLDNHPGLVQLALRRQPWNEDERAAGGIVEQHPDAYTEAEWGPYRWLEHREFFTTNPSLYRRSLFTVGPGWPDAEHSEGVFSHRLLADPTLRVGFWGDRNSGEWVRHIGTDRVGTGY
jgi:hypothetical protein